MQRRDSLRLGLGLLLTSGGFTRSWAGYQSCAGQPVGSDVIRCPDGAIPSYAYGDPPAPDMPAASKRRTTTPIDPIDRIVGVWHTPVEGLSYRNALDVPGSSAIDTKISLHAGDLTIAPNGAFVWNTVAGLYGHWLTMRDEYWTFMLIQVGGVTWRGRIDDDGRLRLRRDSDTLVFGTR